MYRVEDERYEVDMVTELNRMAMHNLVVVKRKMDNMKREELAQFQLDDNLSGTSAILMRKAIHRYVSRLMQSPLYLASCRSAVRSCSHCLRLSDVAFHYYPEFTVTRREMSYWVLKLVQKLLFRWSFNVCARKIRSGVRQSAATNVPGRTKTPETIYVR